MKESLQIDWQPQHAKGRNQWRGYAQSSQGTSEYKNQQIVAAPLFFFASRYYSASGTNWISIDHDCFEHSILLFACGISRTAKQGHSVHLCRHIEKSIKKIAKTHTLRQSVFSTQGKHFLGTLSHTLEVFCDSREKNFFIDSPVG